MAKSEAAAELARRRAASMTKKRRREIAEKAAAARWEGHVKPAKRKRRGAKSRRDKD